MLLSNKKRRISPIWYIAFTFVMLHITQFIITFLLSGIDHINSPFYDKTVAKYESSRTGRVKTYVSLLAIYVPLVRFYLTSHAIATTGGNRKSLGVSSFTRTCVYIWWCSCSKGDPTFRIFPWHFLQQSPEQI